MSFLHHASVGIGILGAVVIGYGVLKGLVRFLRAEWSSFRGHDSTRLQETLRHALGYNLLLGLEFLIAADIIVTLMEPDLERLLILGVIVVVRTIISFSLQVELRQGQENHVASSRGSVEISANPSHAP